MLKVILLIISIVSAFSQDKIDPSILGKETTKKKRFIFTDEKNDNIMVLDLAIRKRMKEASKNKDSKNQLEEDVWSNFYKQSSLGGSSEKNAFEIYIIESGDDWQSISQKIYEDKKYWPHLQSWNEELLNKIDLPAGGELKYLRDIKDQ